MKLIIYLFQKAKSNALLNLNGILMVMSLLWAVSARAQPTTVSGTVKADDNETLAGVTVQIKGTTRGTTTNVDGLYSLSAESDDLLVFSFIGFKTIETKVGNRTTIDMVLEADIQQLQEIVVTSFGLEKSKKEIVYATQEIEGSDLDAVGNPNVLNSLQGKAAGVSVNLSSGQPGREPTVNIRGSRSITGNNQPLYVVDGLPIAGRAIDINPNDIESMNILKGPTASALYGIRAANGVVVITTKSGSSTSGRPVVTLDLYSSIDQVGYLPDLQQVYSQGNGTFSNTSGISYGPRISELGSYVNNVGEEVVGQAYDHSDAFFENGFTINSNISVAQNREDFSYYLSMGQSYQEGIIPNTGLERVNFKANLKSKITNRLTASVFFNFSETDVDDFPDLAGNKNYFRGLWEAPPSYNLAGTQFASDNDPYQQVYFRGGQNNPYWVVENNYRTSETPRILGNFFLEYEIAPSLTANYRLGIDRFNTTQEEFRELGTGDIGRTVPPSGGSLTINTVSSQTINSNFYLAHNAQLNESISIETILGSEFFDQRIDLNSSLGQNFVSGGFPNLANATLITASNTRQDQRIVGFYGNVNVGWEDKIYLNISGRNDYVSNLPADNRSFFYPSIGTSFVLTNLVPSLEDGIISFAKLRASFAEVGQAGPLYVNNNGFTANNPGGFTFPFNGLNAFSSNTTRISPDLEPENTRTVELGFDLRFLNDRFNIDYTYFNSTSENQIFSVPLAFSAGAAEEIRNGGEISSSGHEIVLSTTPVLTDNFRWNLTTNFFTYENTVESLADGIDRITITSPDGVNAIQVAEVGQDFPSFFGISFQTDPATGRTLVLDDPSSGVNGMPIIDFENRVIGSPLPDFRMNFINNLTYKNLNLMFQIDWSQGGQIFSQSAIETRFRGTSEETLSREQDVIIDGVKGSIDENGNVQVTGENDIPINKAFTYYTHIWQFRGAYQDALQDASFVRLREVRLTYDFSSKMLDNTFLEGLSLYFAGRNLFLITDSFVDPEVNYVQTEFGNRFNSQGVEWNQTPQTRSFGLGLTATF
ncbi:MAG: SusC/RagA family TonB-linked outer membrane protein [Bacteroidota bacterium]